MQSVSRQIAAQMAGTVTTGKNENARAKTLPALAAQIAHINNDLVKAGWPAGSIAITCTIAQIMLESDWMTSKVANVDNNWTGIKYINASYQNATKGLPAPDGGNYAHFASWQAFLADYRRVLSLNTGGHGKPIDATTATQFIDRLKANKYFTDTNYLSKFNSALQRVNEALRYTKEQNQQYRDQAAKGQDTYSYDAGKGLIPNSTFNRDKNFNQLTTWIEEHPIAAAGTGLGLFLVIAMALKR